MKSKSVVRIFASLLASIFFLAPVFAADDAGAEPDRVVVQHILIGFKRSIAGKKIQRTKREAQFLAEKLLERALGGEDFDALVKEYTDDNYPGIYPLANSGVDPAGGRSRGDMVPGFGDAAFSLGVGEVVLVPFHGWKSPYGWHIIKRLE